MGTEVALPAGFGNAASVFGGSQTTNDELGAGVNASYGIVGYRGKVWSIRYNGVETPLMRDDGDGPRNSIEVVLLKASPAVSKIFYKNGYVEGSNAAPDCWSANGVTPDASVQEKMNPTCADCPMNAWGSRTTEAGKNGKMCADSRRVAVVPLADLDNELFGGPMLLRIPAATLKDLKAYGDLLNSHQFPYYAAATRISFDPKEAYPKFVFSAIRPLNEAEALRVVSLREDRRTSVVLSEDAVQAGSVAAETKAKVAASPFETPEARGETSEPKGSQPDTPAGNAPAAAPAAAPAETASSAEEAELAELEAQLAAARAAAKAKAKAKAEAEMKAAAEAKAAEAAKAEAAKPAVDPGAAAKAEALRKKREELARQLAALEAEEAPAATEPPSAEAGGSVEAFDNMLDDLLKP